MENNYDAKKEEILKLFQNDLKTIRKYMVDHQYTTTYNLIELLVCMAYSKGGMDGADEVKRLLEEAKIIDEEFEKEIEENEKEIEDD